jgi:hypothetical protein
MVDACTMSLHEMVVSLEDMVATPLRKLDSTAFKMASSLAFCRVGGGGGDRGGGATAREETKRVDVVIEGRKHGVGKRLLPKRGDGEGGRGKGGWGGG